MTNYTEKGNEVSEINYDKISEKILEEIGYTQEGVIQKTMSLIDPKCSLQNLKALKEGEKGETILSIEIEARKMVINELLIANMRFKGKNRKNAKNNSSPSLIPFALRAYLILEKEIEPGDTVEYREGGEINSVKIREIGRIEHNGIVVMTTGENILPNRIIRKVYTEINGVKDIEGSADSTTDSIGSQKEAIMEASDLLKKNHLHTIPQVLMLTSPARLTNNKEQYIIVKEKLCTLLGLNKKTCVPKIIRIIFGEEESHDKNVLEQVYRHTLEIIGTSPYSEVIKDETQKKALSLYIIALKNRHGPDEYTGLKPEGIFKLFKKHESNISIYQKLKGQTA